MPLRKCIEESILFLTLSPIVESFTIVKRRETEGDGFLRARAVITDASLLEISMYWQLTENAARLIAYRFHWQDDKSRLIRRWDNAKHHPEINTFPFHMHDGEEEKVKKSAHMELWDVLRILEAEAEET